MKTVAGAGVVLPRQRDVYMVQVHRRGMTRWELPSAIMRLGESPQDTAFRCIFEESRGDLLIGVTRPICLCLHASRELERTYYGMFFLGERAEGRQEKLPVVDVPGNIMPTYARQQIIKSDFKDWRRIPDREIHPVHQRLLQEWDRGQEELFLVSGDADLEVAFYRGALEAGSLHISLSYPLPAPGAAPPVTGA